MTTKTTTALVASLTALGLAAPAFAESSVTHADLLARIEALEAANASPNLGFNIGPNTTLDIYGFVRVEAFYDLDFEQPADLFQVANLDTQTPTDGTFDTSVRVSRLGFRTTTETDIGAVGGQLEFDLFGGEGRSELRVRHANVTVGGFLVGQFWTNFMPIGEYPTTADFNGPVGITFARVPQVRYSGDAGDFNYSFSIEQAAWASRDPVLTAAASYSTDLFTARIAGIAGTVEDGANDVSVSGFVLSGEVAPWQGGTINASYTTGDGIGGLMIGSGDEIVGGQANGVNGYTVGFQQALGDFSLGFAYGFEEYDNPGAENLSELESLHVNAFYRPTDQITIGLEYITGERTDGVGAVLEADRIGASFTYSF